MKLKELLDNVCASVNICLVAQDKVFKFTDIEYYLFDSKKQSKLNNLDVVDIRPFIEEGKPALYVEVK